MKTITGRALFNLYNKIGIEPMKNDNWDLLKPCQQIRWNELAKKLTEELQ